MARLTANGSLAPGAGGDLITFEGGALGRPRRLRSLVEKTDAHNDWAAVGPGDRENLADRIGEEAGRLLDGPRPPRG
ncbi:hypothetical protein ACWEPA_23195 [Streptomyces filamentosus]